MAEPKKEFFCIAPFAGGYVDIKKIAYPCCKIKMTAFDHDPQCDLTKNDLNTAVRSKAWSKLRDSFSNNIKPPECSECWNAEDAGCTSERKHLLHHLKEVSIDKVGIRKLQIIPSITCNFKCRMCDSNFSSAIALEKIKNTHDTQTKEQLTLDLKNNTLIDIEYYKRILEKSLHTMTLLQILGGEPFLMKNLPELLEHIIDQGHNEHISVYINTNGSSWSDRLVSLLTKFKGCITVISVDAIGKRFEDERGGSWGEVEEIFNRWLTVPNITVHVTVTVSIQNVLYVDELIDFLNSKGVDFGWNYVDDPAELCIDNMTDTAKELVYNKLKDNQHYEVKSIVNRVVSATSTSGKAFIDLMDLYDLRRGTNFKQSHGEIYDAMSAK